jgi:hypothetical protein
MLPSPVIHDLRYRPRRFGKHIHVSSRPNPEEPPSSPQTGTRQEVVEASLVHEPQAITATTSNVEESLQPIVQWPSPAGRGRSGAGLLPSERTHRCRYPSNRCWWSCWCCSRHYCGDLMIMTDHSILSHNFARCRRFNAVAWRHLQLFRPFRTPPLRT